ncbi:MAG: amidohydrolase family protein [Acidobacteria bacterium]|nr:amidohydrolase family protein [Acidobacteriota bacterium]
MPLHTRRAFLASTAAATAALAQSRDAIIDIHQHTDYTGRSDEALIAHQDKMGITKTVLLPAGSRYGLEAEATGNDRCLELVRRHPAKFTMFANEVPYDGNFGEVIEKYLKLGAIGIGEQKFFVDVLSPVMDKIATVAQANGVPVLLHFQHERYNVNYDQFYRVLAKYPRVNFIGHAQTFWANVDSHQIQDILYPKWKVTAGGWTDRFLRDYPNMFADLSAGSGLNSMTRDLDHARAFVARHQDKLIYGSDCNDSIGTGPKCSGSEQLAMMRKLAPNPAALRKIFELNAKKVMKV